MFRQPYYEAQFPAGRLGLGWQFGKVLLKIQRMSEEQAWSAESAFIELEKKMDQLEQLAETANEAETRLKIVDEILFGVLNWSKQDVEVEKFERDVGYADYVLYDRKIPLLVIEAKRTGSTFILKTNQIKPLPVAFALLEQECPDAGKALRQALGYAASLGARFIAITNGNQWIIALTYVQSQAVEERQVIVFDSFVSIKDYFRTFYDCFSPLGLADNRVHSQLLESRKRPAPQKKSSSIPGYPAASKRNTIGNELTYLLTTVWDVLSRTESSVEFLSECYVPPTSNHDVLMFAKDLLRRRIEADRIQYHPEVAHARATDIKSAVIGYNNEKPFVILGEVGRGKTTFLNHFRLISAKDALENYIQIEVNFLDRPDFPNEVVDFVYREIESALLGKYEIDIYDDALVRGALHFNLQRFYKSARYKLVEKDAVAARAEEKQFIQEHIGNKHEYLKCLMAHLKRGRNHSIAIFFDNLDRRNPEIQDEAFLKASAIARDWQCVAFITLRPSTFFKSLKKGVLDSLAPKTFTVGSPDLSLVLKRRFRFAERLALGEIMTPILEDARGNKEISFRLPSVAQFFHNCAFTTRKDIGAIEMLTAMSNGNIRTLVELAKRVLISGHLDTKKILEQIEQSGSYLIPDYEAEKTLIYGDFAHYDPKSSIFINLFDIYHSDEKEHFLRILTLDHLSRFNHEEEERNWVEYHDLLQFLEAFYFDVATIQRHLKALVEGECVESSINDFEGSGRKSAMRATARGRYHLNNASKTFQYLDAVTMDTPIIDVDVSERMVDTQHVDERIERTEPFIAYLERCAAFLIDGESKEMVLRILESGRKSMNQVKTRVQRVLDKRYIRG